MRTQRAPVLWLLLGLAVLAAAGYAFRPEGGSNATAPDMSAPEVEDGVIASVDAALGREGSSGAATTSVAPLPPVAGEKDLARQSAAAPAAAPALPGGSGAVPGQTAATEDRKIVQTSAIKLQVKDVASAFDSVGRIASGAGGFVAGSNFALQGESQIASVSVRVPATRYQEVLGQLRALGAKVESETSNASDVTEEYSDLSARIRTLEATEGQLLQLLGRAQNVGEVLQVQDRLNSVRSEIERLKGRVALLDRLTELATINVSLRPLSAAAAASSDRVDLGHEISEAWQDSLDFLASIAGGVLTVVVFAWWLPLLALPVAVVGGRWLRSRPHSAGVVD